MENYYRCKDEIEVPMFTKNLCWGKIVVLLCGSANRKLEMLIPIDVFTEKSIVWKVINQNR